MKNIIFFAIICVGGILLQIFLSKKENKWLGLILPILSICISLLAVAGIASFSSTEFSVGSAVAEVKHISEDGEIINEAAESATSAKQSINFTGSLIILIVSTFLLFNIPTAILIAIYVACRENRKKNLTLDKMSIQDL